MKAYFCDDVANVKIKGRKCYKKDSKLIDDLPNYKLAFMHILLKHLDSNAKITFPDWVRKETEEAIESLDKLKGVCDSWFEKDEDHAISWVDFKRILKRDKMFHQIKFHSDNDLLEKITNRLPYIFVEKSNNCKLYTCNF